MDRNYKYSFKKRINVVFFLFFVLTFLLALRLWQLQLQQGKKYTDAIRRQCIRTVRLAPVRGRIEAQDNYIYADNQASFDLEFNVNAYRRHRLGPLNSTIEYIAYQIRELEYFLKSDFEIDSIQIKQVLNSEIKKLIYSFSPDKKFLIEGLFLDDRFFQVLESAKQVSIYLLPSKERLETQGQRTRTAKNLAQQIQKLSDLIDRNAKELSPLVRSYLKKTEQKTLLNQLEYQIENDLGVFQKRVRRVLYDYHIASITRHMLQTPALPYIGLHNLSEEEIAKVSELQPPVIGANLALNSVRKYRRSEEVAHIIGYLQKEEFTKDKYDNFFYFQDEFYGRTGIEKKLNKLLAGEGAMQLLQVDIAGFLHQSIQDNKYLKILKQRGEPKNGYNITLTIDSQAQQIAYELMKEHTGSMVVLDTSDGSIKAMVSTPSYNLNTFRKNYSSLVNNKDKPFSNRAGLAGFLPGSIVKPLIALGGLQKFNFDPLQIYDCTGEYQIYKNFRIRCSARSGHGKIDLFKALEVSCNPYFIDLAVKMGISDVQNIYREFGVGQKLDLPLTQIQRGLLPGGKHWTKADTCYVSIGQGKIGVSPLQAAFLTSIIANKGNAFFPHIIKQISNPYTDKVVFKKKAKKIPAINIKPKYWDMIHHGMRQVVIGEEATAKRIRTKKGLQVAGKTGTVERRVKEEEYERLLQANKSVKTKGRFFFTKDTWFVCFAPYDKPRYAIAVLVESGDSGGDTAAPIARAFLDLWTKKKNEIHDKNN